MKRHTVLWAIVFVVAAATAFAAQTVVIPKYTVIPVVMVDELSSATNKVGDKFETRCEGGNCGGFPERTTFVGVVTEVTKQTKSAPGSIEVSFVEAVLPDSARVPISGTLIALSEDTVKLDPVTGNLVGTEAAKKERGKFTKLGARGGLLVSGSGRKVRGGLRGAVVGILVATVARPKTITEDVVVSVGTEIGILLGEPVKMDAPPPPAPPKVSTNAEGATVLAFTEALPYQDDLALMVPFRPVMDALGKSFTYEAEKREITVSADPGIGRHVVLTDEITVGEETVGLETRSVLRNGILYVPKELIELTLGTTMTWDEDAETLTLS